MTKNEMDISTLDCFSEIDRQFSKFLVELSGADNEELMIASLLVSSHIGKGDICIDISEMAGKKLSEIYQETDEEYTLPTFNKWINGIKNTNVAGLPGDYKPLILDEKGRLYLYRYWQYEKILADNILSRNSNEVDDFDEALLKEGIKNLFPDSSNKENQQRIAAVSSILQKFCVISGGPGTGKTTTVVKIIVLLIEQALKNGYKPSIALAAPTGKAAARLKESVKQMRVFLNCPDEVKTIIPDEAYTIHRLLGPLVGSPYFRYDKNNQLNYDIVIIDESSMADLALITKLFTAVPLSSRIIILGDKDQLASVEAGAVLGDICDTGNMHGCSVNFIKKIEKILQSTDIVQKKEPPIADAIVKLNMSFRFDEDSGIGNLSKAVKEGKADDAMRILNNDDYKDISLFNIDPDQFLPDIFDSYITSYYELYLKETTITGAFGFFSNFSILCALRQGPGGVNNVNLIIEKKLKERGLINTSSKWYNGRPIMINRNDYNLKLFNGDIGIIYPDNETDNKPKFFYQTPEGSFRKILPIKLPEHETVYAMTVHKSQGSEFDHVLLVLPDRPGPVLSRELLYTAITRARKKVDIVGSEEILRLMIDKPSERKSGLRDALWENR